MLVAGLTGNQSLVDVNTLENVLFPGKARNKQLSLCPQEKQNTLLLQVAVAKISVLSDVEESLKEVRSIAFGIFALYSKESIADKLHSQRKDAELAQVSKEANASVNIQKCLWGPSCLSFFNQTINMIKEAADLLLKGLRHGFKWTNISAIPPIDDSPDSTQNIMKNIYPY
ncbi:hypothetical protein QVD17_30879 [Tagetes erecta]|uniref:Uncharacterized protein n=1 Tax=Tagetes erecta TaxID=13708 RepID=A0AAD8K3D5_TARER|nr:hypothetical protein QVD17_30879 [Tagetes erecta]